ncbi:NUDIX domain-containing protein [Microbulbifer yueqingensis]|uniref:ADP-ribose pyrophosphatase n=1 Tax=Microbulbifer yueqingensis TaxID=658219 RepID=A0A1G8YAG9_9GAMM|nr:NUDIX domain-containing protein [Microbulbifer yueqingensis]SDJ99687.1 ADP-ribose pyrophosphatase [Microbulbifer yueqingensis]
MPEYNEQTRETELKPSFSRDAVEVVERTTVFDGFFKMMRLRLRHRLFRGGWSGLFERELFVRDNAVGVLLFDPRRELVGLIEQFRVGALQRPGGPWCLEVVAGMVEEGESLEEVARREVEEESGLDVGELEFIHSYMPSPGGSSERLHLYCALADLDNAGGIFGLPEENEDIRLRVIPLDRLLPALSGSAPEAVAVDNAATLICLQWLQLNRARLTGRPGTERG